MPLLILLVTFCYTLSAFIIPMQLIFFTVLNAPVRSLPIMERLVNLISSSQFTEREKKCFQFEIINLMKVIFIKFWEVYLHKIKRNVSLNNSKTFMFQEKFFFQACYWKPTQGLMNQEQPDRV